jgi:hypothetical protein
MNATLKELKEGSKFVYGGNSIKEYVHVSDKFD